MAKTPVAKGAGATGTQSIRSFFTPKPKAPDSAAEDATPPRPSKGAVSPSEKPIAAENITPISDKKAEHAERSDSSAAKTKSKSAVVARLADSDSDVGKDEEAVVRRRIEPGPQSEVRPKVGDSVEVLFDGSKWYKGILTAHDAATDKWQVEFEDGDETEVKFPDPDVRLVATESPKQRSRRAASGRKRYALESSDEESEDEEHVQSRKVKDKREKSGRKFRRIKSASDSEDSEYKMDVVESEPEQSESDAVEDEDELLDEEPKPSKGRAAKGSGKKGQATKSPPAEAAKRAGATSKPTMSFAEGARSADKHTVSEQKKEKANRFEAKNHDRYKWLDDVKDAQGRRPTEDGYDGRTLLVPKAAYNEFTNFEKQFWDIKKNHWDVVLFFKKGKFYEMFEKDADVGHKLLHLKLTDRTNMRMCGVPEGQFANYANQLVAKGYKVGRVEQMETLNAMQKRAKGSDAPKTGQVCERELCQILTQGTLVDETMLGTPQANYLLSVTEGGRTGSSYGVCLLEASTGVFFVGEFADDALRTHLETLLIRSKPREAVFPKGQLNPVAMKLLKRHIPPAGLNALEKGSEFWDADRTARELSSGGYFGDAAADWPPLLREAEGKNQTLCLSAVGGCVSYLRGLLLDSELVSMRNFRHYSDFSDDQGVLAIDGQTLANLEILENSTGGTEGTLFRHLDHCSTAFGKRLLRAWVCSPLRDPRRIEERLDAVDALRGDPAARDKLVKKLKTLCDVERALSRVHMEARGRKQGVMFDNSSARKLRAFLQLLDAMSVVCDIQEESGESTSLLSSLPMVNWPADLRKTLRKFKQSYGDLSKAADDGFISPETGIYEDYDQALERLTGVEEKLEDELTRCKSLLKERSLKFWHPAAGKEPYQIEVPMTWLDCKGNKLPSEFELKSQTSKIKRYWTPTVSALVAKLVDARETLAELRQGMATRMQQDFDSHYAMWSQAVEAAAVLDCLASLSLACDAGAGGPMCRPEFLDVGSGAGRRGEATLELRESRHPCVGRAGEQPFIPNDILLGCEADGEGAGDGGEVRPRACVVTGPNMGGKSTLLRQACVCVIMAQLGAHVPARACRLRPVDRIFTRIGANDRIVSGQSTFLVELSETATILEHATARSLVVLDELGRGTSTYDGYAIAHAVLHDLVTRARPLLLFSTHYHTLTDELRCSRTVSLYRMECEVDEARRRIAFMYRFRPGVASQSYGLHCAQAAGLPTAVVARAEEQKRMLEGRAATRALRRLALFAAAASWRPGAAGAAQALEALQRDVATALA